MRPPTFRFSRKKAAEMADIADITSERDEAESPARIAASRRPVGPEATGFCLSCEEPVPAEHRWCNLDCRTDWVKESEAAERRGRER